MIEIVDVEHNLTKQSDETQLRDYFNAVLRLYQDGAQFPVDLDNVWMLVYARKDVAVRELKKSFVENEDYCSFHQKAEREIGGSIRTKYQLSVSCFEYFIAKKVRAVFEVYRQVFKKVASGEVRVLPKDYVSALRELASQVEENERLALENKEKEEKITMDAPKVGYYDEVLQKKTTFTMTEVADEIGLSVYKLIDMLIGCNIIYRSSSRYLLKVPFKSWNLHCTRTPKCEHGTPYLVWNERGRMFIHRLYECDWNVKAAIKKINPRWTNELLIFE